MAMESHRSGFSHKPKADSSKVQIRIISTTSSSKVPSNNVTKEKQSSIKTTVTSNIETFACFWLDQDMPKTKAGQEIQIELRKVIPYLQMFENLSECEKQIRNTTQEKIILISSNILAQQIVPCIHDLSQFRACYVFNQSQPVNKQWIASYSKVKGIFGNRSELLDQISRDQVVRTRLDDSGTVSVVSGDKQTLESRNATFMWFQLFIQVLLRMHNTSSSRQELIDICEEYYRNNPSELTIVDEFKKAYRMETAIWWYTRECFLYRILNKALRLQEFDTLFALRFFITDLSQQLMKEYERCLREMPTRDIIRVYRGQAMSFDELKLIQANIGQFISMNSFLSTSLQRETAVSFLDLIEVNSEVDRILFEIDIDPRQKTTAFSDIDHLSYFKCENEILIMLGALFLVKSVRQDKSNKFWIAHITLSSEDDFHLKETFAHMKEKIGDETNLHSLGKILTEMGQYEQAKKCYKRMIYQSQLDESIGYSGLGWADHWLNEYDRALSSFHKSLTLINEILPNICEEKGRLYSLIGLVYWRKKQYPEALANLNKALDTQQAVLSPDHPDLLATYNRFALTYGKMDETDKALEYHEKCLSIRLATLPRDHPDIATSYNNIGWLYNERIGDYAKALEYFEKSLALCRKILPPTHRDIIRSEQNIRKVNEKLKNKSDT